MRRRASLKPDFSTVYRESDAIWRVNSYADSLSFCQGGEVNVAPSDLESLRDGERQGGRKGREPYKTAWLCGLAVKAPV